VEDVSRRAEERYAACLVSCLSVVSRKWWTFVTCLGCFVLWERVQAWGTLSCREDQCPSGSGTLCSDFGECEKECESDSDCDGCKECAFFSTTIIGTGGYCEIPDPVDACCRQDEVPCGDTCCPPNGRCIGEGRARECVITCRPGETFCEMPYPWGPRCCSPDECCCPGGGCIPRYYECCPDGESCPPGRTCVINPSGDPRYVCQVGETSYCREP
jgi:hypothetical protein